MSLVEGVGNLDGGHIGIEDGRDGNVWCLGTIAWVSTIMVSSLSVPIGVLQRYPPRGDVCRGAYYGKYLRTGVGVCEQINNKIIIYTLPWV